MVLNKFEQFICDLDQVTNQDDLCNAICKIGLFKDARGIYGTYNRFQVDIGGVWQDPNELATFLWKSRNDFKNVQSYLDIGTFNGYTFFVIMSFLKKFVASDIKCKTIDPMNMMHDLSIVPYILPYYECCTTDDIALRKERYDLVFIDGCHEAPWPMRDFDNCKNLADIVFFHDIVDKWCPAVRETFENISCVYDTKQYVQSHDKSTFGIGVVFLNSII